MPHDDDVEIFEFVQHPAENDPKSSRANIVLIHGYAEHHRRSDRFVHTLLESGFSVYRFDLRGHGFSSGPRALVTDSFEAIMQDLDYIMRERVPLQMDTKGEEGKKTFVFAHSMGGLIALKFGVDRGWHNVGVSGVVFSGPLIQLPEEPSALLEAVARLLNRVVPAAPVQRPLPPQHMSRDVESQRDYLDDPLIYKGSTKVAMGVSFINAIRHNAERYSLFTTPFLALHGEADKITSPQGTKAFYEAAGSEDKTLKILPGLFHEILHEPEHEQVTADVVQWINERLS